MTSPIRIQLSRRKGWRLPPNTVSVARPTEWGNLVAVGAELIVEAIDGNRYSLIVSRGIAVAINRQLVVAQLAKNPRFLDPLRGKNLACWCPLDQPCHADVLLELANR